MNKRSPKRSPKLGVLAHGLLAMYSAALAGALVLTSPWWLPGLRRNGKYREGLTERLGCIPRKRLQAPVPGQAVLWVHAVSVGEVLAAAPLIRELRLALPQGRVFVSTTTRTGQAIARARFGKNSVFYFPADFAFAVRAWLRYLKPRLLVLVESEFWPRVLFEADRAGIPVAVVNARISSRSWPRYRRLRPLWHPLLGTLALVQAQTCEDAERLLSLGAPTATIGRNLKYDVQPAPATPLLRLLQAALPPGADVLVCGSTLPGEEELLLQALPPDPVLLLAPRHPERFDEAAALLQASGRRWQRVSIWRHKPQPVEPGSVLLLDSVGELTALYALATVAIVGGGFLHAGGHNPLEPAGLGKPVVIGTGYANFAEIVETLQAAQAIEITDNAALSLCVAGLLTDPQKAAGMGRRAQQICREQGGATARALAALLALVTASP